MFHKHSPQKCPRKCTLGSSGHPDLSSFSSFEPQMPLKTPHPTHCFISIGLLKQFNGLCCRFPESDPEFLMFALCVKIPNAHVHIVAKTRVTQVLMLTSRGILTHESYPCCMCSKQFRTRTINSFVVPYKNLYSAVCLMPLV